MMRDGKAESDPKSPSVRSLGGGNKLKMKPRCKNVQAERNGGT